MKMKKGSCPGLGAGTNAQMILALNEVRVMTRPGNLPVVNIDEAERLYDAIHALTMDMIEKVEAEYEPTKYTVTVHCVDEYDETYKVEATSEEDAKSKVQLIPGRNIVNVTPAE